MRLIDADALIEKAIEEKKFVFTRDSIMDDIRGEKVCETVYKDLHEFIASAPTVEQKWMEIKTMEENNKENSQMQEVAAILGLQIREPFKVIEGDGECYEDIFRFDHDGIYWLNTVSSSWLMTTEKYILWELVVGQLKILRLIGEHDGSLQK